jgi:hypothetical protein
MMADIVALTPEERAEYEEWVASRPEIVRQMIATHPPTKLYRLADTNQRVTIASYGEDGTVSVTITGQYNVVAFDRQVFGIPLAALTECELPGPEEETGTLLTSLRDAQVLVNTLRPLVLNTAQKARLIKELHDKSGLELMKCRTILSEHSWDIEAAIKTLLRERTGKDGW